MSDSGLMGSPPPDAIHTRMAIHWKGKDGIVRVRYTTDEPETLEDAREHIAVLRRLCPNSRAALLLDTRKAASMMPVEVRAFYTSDQVADVLGALAVVVGSAGTRFIGNLVLRFQHTRIRTRIFSDEALALHWLRGQNLNR